MTMPASDLELRLAKWQPVKMSFDSSIFTPREREMIEKLVEASQHLDSIYWRQSDPEGFVLYKTTGDPKLRRLLTIHGARFDLIDHNQPFGAPEPVSPG